MAKACFTGIFELLFLKTDWFLGVGKNYNNLETYGDVSGKHQDMPGGCCTHSMWSC